MDWDEWNEDTECSYQEEYESLIRGIRLAKGFGLRFVESDNPLLVAKRICNDLSTDSNCQLFHFKTGALLQEIKDKFEDNAPKVLILTNLENVLTSSTERKIPPILYHLQQQRENFLKYFPHTIFVFVSTEAAITTLIKQAPDFFDWGLGFTTIN